MSTDVLLCHHYNNHEREKYKENYTDAFGVFINTKARCVSYCDMLCFIGSRNYCICIQFEDCS